MATAYAISHPPPQRDLDIPPIKRWSLILLTCSPEGLVTPLTIEDSGSDTDFQGRVMKGRVASTLSLDHWHLEP